MTLGYSGTASGRPGSEPTFGYLASVFPGLADLSLTAIAIATAMSTSAASKVRSGKRVPILGTGDICYHFM